MCPSMTASAATARNDSRRAILSRGTVVLVALALLVAASRVRLKPLPALGAEGADSRTRPGDARWGLLAGAAIAIFTSFAVAHLRDTIALVPTDTDAVSFHLP